MIIPVVLSGGSGTRLWPLSTPQKPKQFLPLITDHSLFQETLLRLHGVSGVSQPVIVCNAEHFEHVAEQLRGIDMAAGSIVLEPAARNTAPALGVAALLAQRLCQRAAPEGKPADDSIDPILLVLPADHVIQDVGRFQDAVAKAVDVASSGRLVTFGVVPTHPETGYGYIEGSRIENGWAAVERFVEKPDKKTAEDYLASKRYYWNSGMFVFGAATLLGELERHVPDIYSACVAAAKHSVGDSGAVRLGAEFLASPSESIDYAVMEATDKAAVIPLDAGWNDVGSWSALYGVLPKDANGNVLRGNTIADDCSGCYVHSTGKPLAVLGLHNAVVVQTDSAVLIASQERAQGVKQLAERFSGLSAGDKHGGR